MDIEREKLRQTYLICRLGFAVISGALILAVIPQVLLLIQIFFHPRAFAWIFQAKWFHWLDTPIVWGTLIGTYLLWGRWSETGWQRRVGLLLLMCMIDVILWFLDHGDELGLRLQDVGHNWLRAELGSALGWAEFALLASLSCDLLAHLGVSQAAEAGKATRSLAATGAVVWMIAFYDQTDWRQGWPLMRRGIATIPSLLVWMGSTMIWTITLVQVCALSIATTRQASRVLSEMEREDQDHDLLGSPSDQDFDLLAVSRDDGSRDSESTAFSW